MHPTVVSPPANYVQFAANTDGWQFWVPPANQAVDNRITKFVFLHPGENILAKSGPEPSVSVGHATVNTDTKCFYTFEVENDYSERTDRKPHIRGFLVLWFKYLNSIAGSVNCAGIEIGNVNDHLGQHLHRLGFDRGSDGSRYIGKWDKISRNVDARCTDKGWHSYQVPR